MLQLISNNSRGGGGSAYQRPKNTVRKLHGKVRNKSHKVVHGLSVVPSVLEASQRGRTKGFHILGSVYKGSLLGALIKVSRMFPYVNHIWVWTPQPLKKDRHIVGVYGRID
jgi:hypothetical protein